MFTTIRLSRASAAIALSLSVGGCFGGEPSASDMLDAMKKDNQFRQSVVMMANIGNMGRDVPFDEIVKKMNVEKLGYVNAQNAQGHVCDFRTDFRLPNGALKYSDPVKARFFQTNSGWTAAD